MSTNTNEFSTLNASSVALEKSFCEILTLFSLVLFQLTFGVNPSSDFETSVSFKLQIQRHRDMLNISDCTRAQFPRLDPGPVMVTVIPEPNILNRLAHLLLCTPCDGCSLNCCDRVKAQPLGQSARCPNSDSVHVPVAPL